MRGRPVPSLLLPLAALLFVGLPSGEGDAGSIDPALAAVIKNLKPGERVAILVSLADRVTVAGWAPKGDGDRDGAPSLIAALRAKASETQGPLAVSVSHLGAGAPSGPVVSLWAINAMALTVPHELVAQIAQLAGVDTVRLDAIVWAPQTTLAVPSPVEWNVAMIGAPTLWAAGKTGSGVVVASLDTGVDALHADLSPRYRGGTNSWYDPNGQHALPYDAQGHGTQTMGLAVGGGATGSSIGVAPGARWIAAKAFDDAGHASLSALHLAFQWILDPDANPSTPDQPDVVNNSWGLSGTSGTCNGEFAADITLLRAAGIEVIFAAGNDGPLSGSSESPANDPGAIAIGAVDQTRTVASSSSRGPGACGQTVFPNLVAPGVSVKTSDLTFGGILTTATAFVSGTSFAAPHLAGAFALLKGAHPSATLTAIENALDSTATDLGTAGPDNDHGFGLPNLPLADAQLSLLPPPPAAAADAYTTTIGTNLSVVAPGVLGNDTAPSGLPLSAALVSPPSAGTLSLLASGAFSYVPPAEAGTFAFAYRVTDGNQWSAAASVTITVSGTAGTPVANADAYTATAGVLLAPAAPGLLGNDTSPSGLPLTAQLVTPPTFGLLSLAANGTFTYSTKVLAAGTDSFTYRASDGATASGPATVTIGIAAHPAPVARSDSFAVPRNSSGVSLNVLANDTASNATLLPSTVLVVSRPTRGGTTAVNVATGAIVYKPSRSFVGTDVFAYNVRDSLGALSNIASVQVNVR